MATTPSVDIHRVVDGILGKYGVTRDIFLYEQLGRPQWDAAVFQSPWELLESAIRLNPPTAKDVLQAFSWEVIELPNGDGIAKALRTRLPADSVARQALVLSLETTEVAFDIHKAFVTTLHKGTEKLAQIFEEAGISGVALTVEPAQ